MHTTAAPTRGEDGCLPCSAPPRAQHLHPSLQPGNCGHSECGAMHGPAPVRPRMFLSLCSDEFFMFPQSLGKGRYKAHPSLPAVCYFLQQGCKHNPKTFPLLAEGSGRAAAAAWSYCDICKEVKDLCQDTALALASFQAVCPMPSYFYSHADVLVDGSYYFQTALMVQCFINAAHTLETSGFEIKLFPKGPPGEPSIW